MVMAGKQYVINKGINKPIEFKGLKAQYIGRMAVAMVVVLAVFVALYIAGVSTYVCMPLALGLGGWWMARVFRMSKRYGQFGLMKLGARRRVPAALLTRSRKVFIQLYSDDVRTIR